MKRKYYTFKILIVSSAIILVPILFFNNWILMHDVPVWLRTAVYMVNPPDKLRSAIQVLEIVDGRGDINYISEYYGRYSIYIAKDAPVREFVGLESSIEYQLTCKGDAELNVTGNPGHLPVPILMYSVPEDVPVNGKLNCAITIESLENEKLYVVVNKLFDA